MRNYGLKMHKNLRTGGDCEGVFTEFLFLKEKKRENSR